jgi:hypothetical protein
VKKTLERPLSAVFTERAAFGLIWGVALALVAVALITNRNFWLDEAMVYQAVQHQDLLAPGVPLDSYEQALPYGVYVIDKILITAFGFSETVLRLPSVAAYFIGLIALHGSTRTIGTTAGRLAAFAVGAISYQVILQTVMFKHYTFEFAACAVLVAVGLPLFKPDVRRQAVAAFVVAFVLCLPFSNTVIFVALSIIGGAVVARVLDRRQGSRGTILNVVGGGMTSVGIFALWYLVVLRPSTLWQLSLPVYAGQGLLGSPYRYALALLGLFSPADSALIFAAFALALGLVLMLGYWLSFRALRTLPLLVPHLLLLLAVSATIASSLLGFAPFASPRHLVFLMPLIALGLGSSVERISGWIAHREAGSQRLVRRRVVLSGMAAVLLLTGIIAAAGTKQEAGTVLAAAAGKCSDLYVDYTLQPAAMIYLERDDPAVQIHGLVSVGSGSGQNSWLGRVTGNLPGYRQRAVDYFSTVESSCVLTWGASLLIRPIESAGFRCEIVASRTRADIYDCSRAGAAPK